MLFHLFRRVMIIICVTVLCRLIVAGFSQIYQLFTIHLYNRLNYDKKLFVWRKCQRKTYVGKNITLTFTPQLYISLKPLTSYPVWEQNFSMAVIHPVFSAHRCQIFALFDICVENKIKTTWDRWGGPHE